MASLLQGKVLSFAPTLDTNAYATGDQMGTLMTISNVADLSQGAVRIMTLDVIDKAKQAAAFDILFFNASPTVASADNAALDISDSEMASKLVGMVSVASADYKAFNSNSVACLRGLDLIVQAAAASVPSGPNPTQVNLYAILCSRGSPTYAASDLQLRIGLEQI
jgi:hypothetical protein